MSRDRPILPILQRLDTGQVFELKDKVTLIGRNPDCHIRIENSLISKQHAQVVRSGNLFLVEDLLSRNYTFINDQRLQTHQPKPLCDGDVIRVCDIPFLYRDQSITVTDDPTPEPGSTLLGVHKLLPRSDSHRVATDADMALRYLVEFNRAISGSLQLDDILNQTLQTLFEVFDQAECGFILMRVAGSDELVPKAIRRRDGNTEALSISQTILRDALTEGKATLTLDARDDEAYNGVDSVVNSGIRTVMCAPILDRQGQPVGVVQLDTRSVRAQFGPRELELLGGFASQVGVAIELSRLHEIESRHNQVEREQRFARDVQMGLLPHSRPVLPCYAFWDFYEPAKSVGGDYYDYIRMERPGDCESCWAVALGDVAGKGLPASLMMAKLGSLVQMSVLTEDDPVRKLERLNRRLCDARMAERYVTLLLAMLDGDQHRLTLVNAGHTAPILRRASGSIELVGQGSNGMMLGVDADAQYEAVVLDLEVGDVVVLFTDGVNEAMNPKGRWMGVPRVMEAVAQAAPTVKDVGDHLLRKVQEWAAGTPQSDDIAMICFGRTA